VSVLQVKEEWSLFSSTSDNFRKVLLLAAASYFEDAVCGCVLTHVREQGKSLLIESLVRNKAISRQYHTWFVWDGNNANQFFGLFGQDFKNQMSERVNNSAELKSSIKAFLEIGNERNRLVHGNFASFPMEKTLVEIYELYKTALAFVQMLPEALRDCEAQLNDRHSASEGQ